jgi:hypothetical protein
MNDYPGGFEAYCKNRYEEAHNKLIELEKQRLAKDYNQFEVLTKKIKDGDRKAMLRAISYAADTLLVFESLPKEVRETLADALRETVNSLEQSNDFIKRRRGEHSDAEKCLQHQIELRNALRVEFNVNMYGMTRDDARLKASEDFDVNENTIHGHWKDNHKEAKSILDCLYMATDVVADITGGKKLPRKQKK